MKKVSLFLFICILIVSAMDIHSQHINGPVSSSSSKGVRPEIFTTYAFSFKGNSRVLSDSYGNNAASMSALLERVEAERSRIGSGEFKIGVSSNTASSGNEKKALRLARSRALVVKSFLIKKAGLREDDFLTSVTADGRSPQDDIVTAGLVPAAGRSSDCTSVKNK